MNFTAQRHSARTIAMCGLFAALTSAGAFIKIPMPLIPFTLQTFFVILSGLLLGPRLGAWAQAAYLFTGLIGIPVFTKGGGPGYIFEPTFGYIVGFVAGAFVCGYLFKRSATQGFFEAVVCSVAGIAVIYVLGVAHMYFIVNLYLGRGMSLASALWVGAVLCAPGDIISCLLASALCLRLKKAIKI